MDLHALAENIWVADAPPVNVIGPLTLPARTIVVRLRDGTLWIQPAEATAAEMDEVAELGAVAHLISPAKLHTWRLGAWRAHFPRAQCWAPPVIFSDEAPAAWAGEIDQAVFRGNVFAVETEFFHRASRTLVMNDFFQNYRPQPQRPFLDALLALSGARGGGVPVDIQWTMLKKELARQSLRKLLSWDFENLVVAHGDCVIGDAKPRLAAAFRFL